MSGTRHGVRAHCGVRLFPQCAVLEHTVLHSLVTTIRVPWVTSLLQPATKLTVGRLLRYGIATMHMADGLSTAMGDLVWPLKPQCDGGRCYSKIAVFLFSMQFRTEVCAATSVTRADELVTIDPKNTSCLK